MRCSPPDGFFPTKDLVRIDADGYAFFVGRTSDMIKTNSANVSRLEVEAAFNALPEVELAFVAGLPDPELGEIVAAAVVPAPGANPTEAGIKAALRETLSRFKVPRQSCSSPTTRCPEPRPERCGCSNSAR